MALLSSIELEEWWSLIADLVEMMCDRVDEFGGWVANFTGDGILAVFEDNDGDHAQRACDAALALRDALNVRSRQLLEERGLELSFRIGVNSGEVLTGTIGGRRTGFYTACGYAVSLAKRIESRATPGQVHVSEHTAVLLSDWELLELGAVWVKGASAPVGVFELIRRDRSEEPSLDLEAPRSSDWPAAVGYRPAIGLV
jgi:class 3 adenylate cyclase